MGKDAGISGQSPAGFRDTGGARRGHGGAASRARTLQQWDPSLTDDYKF